MNSIGLDLGGTKIEIVLLDQNDQVIERKRVPTEQQKGYRHIINTCSDLINEFVAKSNLTVSVGLGIPGNLSEITGKVKNSNTQCLIGQPLKLDIETNIGRPILVENDANCFVLSEAMLGAGKGYKNVLGIIMGTGVGGGIVMDGKLINGLQGIAGEWGHSTIKYDGPKCWCGQKGCVELYLSGPALEKRYFEMSQQKLSLAEIISNYHQGNDKNATQLVDEMVFYFGRFMANLVGILDPDIIVLGGGVSNVDLLYSKGVDSLKQQIFSDELKTLIAKNKLGDSSGVFGAAMLVETLMI